MMKDEKEEDAKEARQKPKIFSKSFILFFPSLSFFLSHLFQELYRLRTAKKQTKGSTSVWPPTLKACATPPLPTSTCEVGREHKTHVNKRTHMHRQKHRNYHSEGAVGIRRKKYFFSITVLLIKYY